MFLRLKLRPIALASPYLMALAGVAFFLSCPGIRAQTVEQSQGRFIAGEYDSVIKTSSKKLETRQFSDGWRFLLVKSLLMTGDYAAANSNALAGVDEFPGSIRMRLLARESAFFQNDPAGANRQLEEIKGLIQRREYVDQNGDNLVALGRSLLMLGVEPRLVLENCFQRAADMDPPVREAYLASGQLALDKHDFKLAAETFGAGLKKFPDDPDLLTGLAQAYETSDGEQTLKALASALEGNPRNIPALLLLADHLIDAEKYEDAQKHLDDVLAVNPWRPEALAYGAVLAHLRNDSAAEDRLRAKALKFWANNPQVDYLIGLKLAQKYLFEEGAAAQRRAVAFAPDYLPARRQLAEDLLRLGQDEEGWKLAQEARALDEYDVTTYNLATLHDQMSKFRTLTNSNFIVRMSSQEAQLYGDRVLDLLGRASDALCKKYGVELQRPTVVEIFPEQKDFAVRTFGMPGNPGYLGVCFGSVITANSPASQAPNPANWEDVLWHEFCHVVTLNCTRNRMPRWLSEGISVYEERQADPAWGEKMNLSYRDMILNRQLTPIKDLSGAFLQPKNGEALQFAYYESSLVVEFIVQHFGIGNLKQILLDLRDGKDVNDAIAAHTVSMADLQKQFDAFARFLARNLAPMADLEKPPEKQDDAAAPAWEQLHPDNYYVTMRKARELMDAKKWAEAKPVLQSLAESYHGERRGENPLWLEAVTERHLNDTNAELATLQKFSAQEGDFADLELRLIELSAARKDWPSETKHAVRLLQINPLIPAPWQALAEAGAGSGDREQAIYACRRLLMLDPPDPAEAHFRLASLLHQRGGAEAEAKRHVLQALEEAPRYRDAQQLLLEIEAASTNTKKSSTPQT